MYLVKAFSVVLFMDCSKKEYVLKFLGFSNKLRILDVHAYERKTLRVGAIVLR